MRHAHTVRSVVAIVAGFLIIAGLAIGTDTIIHARMPNLFDEAGRMESVPWLIATLGYVFVYATFGCWLAARLAPDRPMRHAMILGWLGLVFNVIGTAIQWATVPAWYHAVALATVMPAAWLGGRIRERQLGSA